MFSKDVAYGTKKAFSQLNWKAILVGTLVDVIGTPIAGMAFTFAKALSYLSQNSLSISECISKFSSDIYGYLVPLMVVGLTVDVLGGIALGMLTKVKILLNAIIAYVFVLLSAFAITNLFPSGEEVTLPMWLSVGGYLLSPVLFIAGAYIGKYLQHKKLPLKIPFEISPVVILLCLIFTVKIFFLLIATLAAGFKTEYLFDPLLIAVPLLLVTLKIRWGYILAIPTMILFIVSTWIYLQNKEPLILSVIFSILLISGIAVLLLSAKKCKQLFFTKTTMGRTKERGKS